MYEASTMLNIKYSTVKGLLQILKKRGTIMRYFKEKEKRIFKIYKECILGKKCKKKHAKPKKIHLQKKYFSDNSIIYTFKPQIKLGKSAYENYKAAKLSNMIFKVDHVESNLENLEGNNKVNK